MGIDPGVTVFRYRDGAATHHTPIVCSECIR